MQQPTIVFDFVNQKVATVEHQADDGRRAEVNDTAAVRTGTGLTPEPA